MDIASVYKRLTDRTPSESNYSGSEANREETRHLFDEFLNEEFDDVTDIEDN